MSESNPSNGDWYKWDGAAFDGVTGLYMFRTREYSPVLGAGQARIQRGSQMVTPIFTAMSKITRRAMKHLQIRVARSFPRPVPRNKLQTYFLRFRLKIHRRRHYCRHCRNGRQAILRSGQNQTSVLAPDGFLLPSPTKPPLNPIFPPDPRGAPEPGKDPLFPPSNLLPDPKLPIDGPVLWFFQFIWPGTPITWNQIGSWNWYWGFGDPSVPPTSQDPDNTKPRYPDYLPPLGFGLKRKW